MRRKSTINQKFLPEVENLSIQTKRQEISSNEKIKSSRKLLSNDSYERLLNEFIEEAKAKNLLSTY